MYEKSRDQRKRRSKPGLNLRKRESSPKTQIQNKVGYTKSRRIIKNVDPIWGWIHEKEKVHRNRRSKVRLDVRKVKRSSKTQIQSGFGSTKK